MHEVVSSSGFQTLEEQEYMILTGNHRAQKHQNIRHVTGYGTYSSLGSSSFPECKRAAPSPAAGGCLSGGCGSGLK